jgi:dynein heavy chain
MLQTTEKVDGLQKLLEIKMVDVENEKAKTNELIEIVGKESLDAEKEADAAAIQAEETDKIANEAKAEKKAADDELAEAIPAMEAATEAVNCLEPKAIQELKALGSPPEDCVQIAKACLILLKDEKKNYAWGNAQKMMNNPKGFIDQVQNFDGDNIADWKKDALKAMMAEPYFTIENMKKKSQAASFLCAYIVNIINYNRIFLKVKPLKESAEGAQAFAEKKMEELQIVKDRVAEINAKVQELKNQLFEAEAKKRQVEEEAQELMDQLDLANRLVNGLSDEKVRWSENVVTFKEEVVSMIGDSLIASAFVSYIGPFSFRFRQRLWSETWMTDITEKKIPITPGIDPLDVLATPSDMAVWNGEGLPADRVSLENAAIVVSCTRYPLLIDP